VGERADLVLADPPYKARLSSELVVLLGALPLVARGGRAALEHHRREVLPDSTGHLVRETTRRFGETVIDVYLRGADPPDPTPSEGMTAPPQEEE
jgi:16S rRNA G966 N2-methylase RsmD